MKFKGALLTGIVLLFLFLEGVGQSIPVRFFNEHAIGGKAVKQRELNEDFGDSTASGILYQNLTHDNLPVSYVRKINTSVCFDGKCRLLDIRLYWNAVGGYLGFELPEGEFLSKTDHDPFTRSEYQKLHAILSDSLSPLSDYSFTELVPGTGDPGETDAVSSATLRDVADYIVPGAAYTTYRLWHLVHGKTASIISDRSSQLYSELFAMALLNSGQPAIQVWALCRMSELSDWNDELAEKVLLLLAGGNLNVSTAALTAVSAKALDKTVMQMGVLRQIAEGPYALRKAAIRKLREARSLDGAVVAGLASVISRLNGDLLGEVLEVFSEKEITDSNVVRIVSEILESENRYTAGKAAAFLERINLDDEATKEKLRLFREGE